LAHKSEQAVRTDPNTCVDTLIDNAKQKIWSGSAKEQGLQS
jgi:hypothetical protein